MLLRRDRESHNIGDDRTTEEDKNERLPGWKDKRQQAKPSSG